jgi:biopolymer transport protein ExbD
LNRRVGVFVAEGATGKSTFFVMPGVCPNSWQTYGCGWTIEYLWRWTDSWERFALLGLALMLARVFVVLASVSYHCHLARRVHGIDGASRAFQRSRRKLVADLSLRVGTLKSIASTAPYLGLVGTCVGVLGTFRGYSGTRHDLLVVMVFGLDAAFLSTAAGLLVTVPAIVSYNYLRTRIESLESEVNAPRRSQPFRLAPKFPLGARFSKIPFAFVAAPVLAACITAFMTFPSFRTPKGLSVAVASAHCDYGGERFITLRITDAGELFLNTEQEDLSSLGPRLSQIYRLRVDRTLYLHAEDGVPFQSVAEALDIVKNANVERNAVGIGANKLTITVRLVTPKSMNGSCPQPVETGSRQMEANGSFAESRDEGGGGLQP